jgi:hypothetical protein
MQLCCRIGTTAETPSLVKSAARGDGVMRDTAIVAKEAKISARMTLQHYVIRRKIDIALISALTGLMSMLNTDQFESKKQRCTIAE